jgi:hypothetical protein
LYKEAKDRILAAYPVQKYFEDLEAAIEKEPLVSAEEAIIYRGKRVHARKRYVKTTFFSGLLRDIYYYLIITYLITTDDRVVPIMVTMHDHID